jgi:hypothetical protein
MTVCAWYREDNDDNSGWGGIISKITSSSWNDGWGIRLKQNATRELGFFVGHYNNKCAKYSYTKDRLWHHVVGTFNDADTNIKLYFDGLELGTADTATTWTPSTADLEIGNMQNFVYQHEGVVDDIRLYDRTMTAPEIWAMYQRTSMGR